MSLAHLQIFILGRCSLLNPGYKGESCLGVRVRATSQIWRSEISSLPRPLQDHQHQNYLIYFLAMHIPEPLPYVAFIKSQMGVAGE